MFVLILILIGLSQTAFFRNYLREELLSIAEQELNGKLTIEKIEGTLFSNLTIYGLNYTQDSLDILKADKIHISFNPFLILSKTISVNDLVIEKAVINLYQFKDSLWIFEKLLRYPPEKDTTPSKPFEYKVNLKNFELVDCAFRLKSFLQSDSSLVIRSYPQFNFSDIYVYNIDLKLKAFASILNNEIQTEIQRFNFATNTDDFEIRDLKLKTKITPNIISLENLHLQTLRTNITLNAKIEKVNIFTGVSLENLRDKNIQVDLNANKFSFSDLKQLLPDVNMLDGSVEVGLKTSGQFGNLKVEWLSAKLDSTELNAEGNIFNLDQPENLYLQVDFINSKINAKDAANLLPLYNLPKFESLGIQKAEIHFEGEPVDFSSNIKLNSSAGELFADAKFNFKKENPTYEVFLSSKDFDIKPFTGIDSKLNINSRIVGEGFSPNEINSDFDLNLYNSHLAGNKIDTLNLKILAKDKVFGINFFAKGDSTKIDLNGKLDFYDENLPKYNISLNTQHFDFSKRLKIVDYPSDLNLTTKIVGEGFKLDQIQGKLFAQAYNSKIRNKKINSFKFESNIDIIENYRSILVRSDLLDLDIVGSFSFENLIDELTNQSDYIAEEVKSKLTTFNPLLIFKDTVITQTQTEENLLNLSEDEINSFNLNYSLRIKNSDLLEIFMSNVQTYIDASINGSISSDTSSFKLELQSNLNDVWLVDGESSKRIKNAVTNLNYEHSNRSIESKNMFLSIKSKADYIFFENEFNDVSFSAEIDPLNIYYKLNGLVDSTIKVRSEGDIDISHSTYFFRIKSATVEYNKYKITNEGQLLFTLNKDKIEFQNFVVRRKDERIKILGEVGLEGKQDLQLQVSSLHLSDLINNVLGDNQNNI
ncbi:MAG: hypothetical protein N3A61_04485, partial [Ignavibacteria bacterium]|nr:hypothetical protein [Ignavibacteria bacterium]